MNRLLCLLVAVTFVLSVFFPLSGSASKAGAEPLAPTSTLTATPTEPPSLGQDETPVSEKSLVSDEIQLADGIQQDLAQDAQELPTDGIDSPQEGDDRPPMEPLQVEVLPSASGVERDWDEDNQLKELPVDGISFSGYKIYLSMIATSGNPSGWLVSGVQEESVEDAQPKDLPVDGVLVSPAQGKLGPLAPQASPNLRPYQPSGWDYPIVPSSVQGTRSVNTLYAGLPTYIDWAVINSGTATASGRFYSCLYLDGSEVGRWYVDNLAANSYTYVSDSSLTVGTAGNHTLKLVTDCTSAIGESNESDNTWERTFTWNPNPNAKPNLRPYQPSGWDYPIVPSSVQGTRSVNTLYAGLPTYIDWSVLNDGTATASGRFYSCLYLDGSEVGRWYVDNLAASSYTYVSDSSLTVATAGNHTLKLVTDCTSAIGESNESDNTWERTFTWNPNPNAKPNLRPYQPSGWDYPIVPSSVQGTRSVNTLYAGLPTYIDWSVINDGTATASGRFYSCLYLDGSEVGRWYVDNLAASSYTYVSDSSLTVGTAGNHTLKLVTDCTSAIGESNENDNSWERTFTWQANPNAKPNLRPYQPSGWDYPIVPSSVQGTRSVNTLYAGLPTYIDWSVLNDGTATASGRTYNCLYLDGTEVGRWYVDNLAANSYTSVSDSSLTVGTAGNHTLKLVADCTSAIGESNENDNSWERTFTWLTNPNAKPNLRPYQPSGWDYPDSNGFCGVGW